MTRKSLRALLVEDCETDAELLIHELEAGGYDVVFERVETADGLRSALQRQPWELVLSDYSLPTFSAPAALAIVQELHPEMPFIIVSGTVGEDTAVAALKAGAVDFLVKGRLVRLIPAIERELREVKLRNIKARERDALEEQLRQSQKLEGLGRLAGGIAHDFNNLLTAIIGYSDMVLDQIGADKPISKDLAEIRDAADRAVALTRQLLAFSRKQTLHVASMDLNEIVSTMRDMLRRLISEDIEISLHLAPALPPILADRIQIEQILLNLVTNARDAMPQGGHVTIETMLAAAPEVAAAGHQPKLNTYVRLRIADTGSGMDLATQSRIFEPFFTTKGVGEGTGLGLATVYGATQQLGGHVAVTSELGHGTTFTLYFPGDTDAVSEKAPETLAPKLTKALAQHREVVLVVEDQRAVRQLVSRMLVRHGYTVLEAGGAAEALTLFAQHRASVDLLLTDVVMPKMGGPELATELCALKPSLRVIFISGYTGEDISRRGPLAHNATVVEKPFSAAALLQAVRDALDNDVRILTQASLRG
jgi:signal transduction histidine kinase